MAHIITLRVGRHDYRVLSDNDDPEAAIAEARLRVREETAQWGSLRSCVRADYTPVGDLEFAPGHDLYAGEAIR